VLVEFMLVRRRVHAGQAGNGRELLLERQGHRRRHCLGTGAGKAGLHADGREVDARQVGDGQLLVGERTEDQGPGHQQRGGDRPLDENR
jgi:hypothetical protein